MSNIIGFLIAVLFTTLSLADSSIPLFFVSNREGEIDLCDCSLSQKGGFVRLEAWLAKQGKERVYLETGNSFFSLPQLNETRVGYEKERAKKIADLYKTLKVDAVGLGHIDFAAGESFVRELNDRTGHILVASNIEASDKKPFVEKYKIIEKGREKIGIISMVSAKSFKDLPALKILEPKEELEKIKGEFKNRGVTKIIALGTEPFSVFESLYNDAGIYALLGGSKSDTSKQLENKKGSVVSCRTESEGAEIGILVSADKKASHCEFEELDKKIEIKNSQVRKIVESFKNEIKKHAVTHIDKTGSRSTKYVANAFTCQKCHSKQYDFWEKTKHASAYLVLYAKDQHFDSECIACHSLGYQEKGSGFTDIADPILFEKIAERKAGETPYIEGIMKRVFSHEKQGEPLDSRETPARYQKLKDKYHEELKSENLKNQIRKLYIGVQCEHCHGDRQGHPEKKVPVSKLKLVTCTVCHRSPHDLQFNFDKKIKQVSCPRGF